jgi:hypothetical protein
MEFSEQRHPFLLLTKDGKLPPEFFHLAKTFSDSGLTVVPITIDHFKNLKTAGQMVSMICCEYNFGQKDWLRNKVFCQLEFLLKGQKLFLYHIGSFGAYADFTTYHFNKNYQFIQLPTKTETLLSFITKNIEKNSIKEIWPGGRSPKLPGQLT